MNRAINVAFSRSRCFSKIRCVLLWRSAESKKPRKFPAFRCWTAFSRRNLNRNDKRICRFRTGDLNFRASSRIISLPNRLFVRKHIGQLFRLFFCLITIWICFVILRLPYTLFYPLLKFICPSEFPSVVFQLELSNLRARDCKASLNKVK